ncbi:MAG: hypothetical protein IJY47_05210 [Clostridia bacterium]|nr:hypothetical protein [Clostridia bacterium]
MSDNRFSCGSSDRGGRSEMVCIETNRILDSCRDRDCFEDVKVLLTDFGNDILEHTTNIRAKNACIAWTYIGIDPVKFNRGFYSVTIKFYVKITFEACLCGGRSQEFDGVAVLEKKVILYGSESNVSMFKSNPDASDYCSVPEPCCSSKNVPIAIVEVVDPMVLNVKVREPEECCGCCCCCNDIPEGVSSRMNGTLRDTEGRYLTVSLGIFSVVRIVRPAQYLINATEYCVPDKECVSNEEDNPCAIFRTMAFPTAEFCPPGYHPPKGDHNGKCGCGS